MTDRYHALTVILDKEIRSDDAENLISAIKMIRGVLDVNPHVSDITTHMAEERAKFEIRERLWNALKSNKEKS